MSRPVRPLALAVLALGAAVLTACGSAGVQVAKDSELRAGAELFAQRCAGCHTLGAAGAQGSVVKVGNSERTDGPNFDQRKERDVKDVLFAIRNGGFSGAIMPQNIVVGEQARQVARFVVACSGKEAKQPKAPNTPPVPKPPSQCGNVGKSAPQEPPG